MMWRHQSTVTLGRKYGLCHTVISCSIVRSALGAIHKGRPEPRGTHANAGGGGQWQKVDVLKFKFLPKFSKFK